MSNTTIRRLSKEEEVLLASLFERADAIQKKAFLENLSALPITTFGGLVGLTTQNAQIFKNSFPSTSPYDKTSFLTALRTCIAWSIARSKEKPISKGGLLASESSEEINAMLLRLRQKEAMLQVIKLSEDVIRLRIANKQASESSIDVQILLPLLSECFGQIANSLKALALFYPESVNTVNDCIENCIKLGRRLAYETKTETEKYLAEFQTTETEMQALMEEIAGYSLELVRLQEDEASRPAFGLDLGEDSEEAE